jgi:hypothetical protein
MERAMTKLPKVMGAVLVLLAIGVTGLEHQGFASKLFGIGGTTAALTATNAGYNGMPAGDFSWSF